jgi:hypothetical protein
VVEVGYYDASNTMSSMQYKREGLLMSKYITPIEGGYSYYCPGCKCSHMVTSKWNIDLKTDTIHPSVLVKENWGMPDDWDYDSAPKNEDGSLKTGDNGKILGAVKTPRCHSWVRNRSIQYLGDCSHELAGKTVPMEVE